MSHEKQIVSGYIEHIDQARNRSERLSASDLHDIARELGLSESDLLRVDEIAAEHLTRGRNFLAHELLDEAISELSRASGLRPLSTEPILLLAQAYADRWKKASRTSDREQAIALARQVLSHDAENQEAYALLSSLKERQVRGSRSAAVVAGMVLLALLSSVVFIGIYMLPSSQPPPQEVVTPTPSTATLPVDGELPVAFETHTQLPGMALDRQTSSLTSYDNAMTYKLSGELVNNTDQLIVSAGTALTLYKADGEILYQHHDNPQASYKPRLRPGDRRAFYHTVHLSPLPENYSPPVRAELTIVKADHEPAAAQYTPATPLTLEWAVDRPGHLDLSIAERSSQISQRSDGSVFHRGEYELHTTPESGAIERLKLQIEYLNADGSVLGADTTWVVTRSAPSMLPGSMQTFSFLEPLPASPEQIRISVVEIR